MGIEPIKKLFKKWKLETATVEMAVGQLIQHADLLWKEITGIKLRFIKQDNRQAEIKREQLRMQAEIERLLKHNDLEPFPQDEQPKRKRGRPPIRKNWWE